MVIDKPDSLIAANTVAKNKGNVCMIDCTENAMAAFFIPKCLHEVFNISTLLIIPIKFIVYSAEWFQHVILINAYFCHIRHIIKQKQIFADILKCLGTLNFIDKI